MCCFSPNARTHSLHKYSGYVVPLCVKSSRAGVYMATHRLFLSALGRVCCSTCWSVRPMSIALSFLRSCQRRNSLPECVTMFASLWNTAAEPTGLVVVIAQSMRKPECRVESTMLHQRGEALSVATNSAVPCTASALAYSVAHFFQSCPEPDTLNTDSLPG